MPGPFIQNPQSAQYAPQAAFSTARGTQALARGVSSLTSSVGAVLKHNKAKEDVAATNIFMTEWTRQKNAIYDDPNATDIHTSLNQGFDALLQDERFQGLNPEELKSKILVPALNSNRTTAYALEASTQQMTGAFNEMADTVTTELAERKTRIGPGEWTGEESRFTALKKQREELTSRAAQEEVDKKIKALALEAALRATDGATAREILKDGGITDTKALLQISDRVDMAVEKERAARSKSVYDRIDHLVTDDPSAEPPMGWDGYLESVQNDPASYTKATRQKQAYEFMHEYVLPLSASSDTQLTALLKQVEEISADDLYHKSRIKTEINKLLNTPAEDRVWARDDIESLYGGDIANLPAALQLFSHYMGTAPAGTPEEDLKDFHNLPGEEHMTILPTQLEKTMENHFSKANTPAQLQESFAVMKDTFRGYPKMMQSMANNKKVGPYFNIMLTSGAEDPDAIEDLVRAAKGTNEEADARLKRIHPDYNFAMVRRTLEASQQISTMEKYNTVNGEKRGNWDEMVDIVARDVAYRMETANVSIDQAITASTENLVTNSGLLFVDFGAAGDMTSSHSVGAVTVEEAALFGHTLDEDDSKVSVADEIADQTYRYADSFLGVRFTDRPGGLFGNIPIPVQPGTNIPDFSLSGLAKAVINPYTNVGRVRDMARPVTFVGRGLRGSLPLEGPLGGKPSGDVSIYEKTEDGSDRYYMAIREPDGSYTKIEEDVSEWSGRLYRENDNGEQERFFHLVQAEEDGVRGLKIGVPSQDIDAWSGLHRLTDAELTPNRMDVFLMDSTTGKEFILPYEQVGTQMDNYDRWVSANVLKYGPVLNWINPTNPAGTALNLQKFLEDEETEEPEE